MFSPDFIQFASKKEFVYLTFPLLDETNPNSDLRSIVKGKQIINGIWAVDNLQGGKQPVA